MSYNMSLLHLTYYKKDNGSVPYLEWRDKLDKSRRVIINKRMLKVQRGLFGQHRNLTHGIKEIKFESGERIYLAVLDDVVILLLSGGDKQRQSDDIKEAIKFITDFNKRK
jgi:putative addiction module killer protein